MTDTISKTLYPKYVIINQQETKDKEKCQKEPKKKKKLPIEEKG